MTPADQARLFLAMTLCGAMLGAAYDALSPLRRLWALPADVAFGVLCAAGMIAVGLAMQAEAFRWFAFCGVLAGGALYRASIGTIVRKIQAVVRKNGKKRRKMYKKSLADA